MISKHAQDPSHGPDTPLAKHSHHAPRILVVEDGIIMARDIERRLQTLGYVVVGIATSGEEAVRLSAQHLPDLILMDVNLRSPMDGIQAAEQIRSTTDVPVVYVTGYSDDATLQRARHTDPFGYVLKPFEERELRTTIEMALYRHALYITLRKSEQRYRALSELTSDFAYALSVDKDGASSTEWVTEAFSRTTGLPPEVLPDLSRHVHPDDAGIVKARMTHLTGGRSEITEYRVLTKEGGHLWFKEYAQPIWDANRTRVIRVMAAAQDVTTQKLAEEQVQKSVRASAECDGEIQEHVNGLAACLHEMLEVVGGAAKGKEKSPIVDEINSRVQQILHVHTIVYDGTSPRRVPLSRHLRVVVADVFRKHGVSRLTYSVDALPVETGAHTAVRVLMILEEVVLNALRHAFPDGRRGNLVVTLGEGGKGKYELRIADNGVGIRRDIDIRKPRTPGLRFVASLVKSVKGSVSFKQAGGTVCTVTFPAE